MNPIEEKKYDNSKKLNGLEFLRLFFCVCAILCHCDMPFPFTYGVIPCFLLVSGFVFYYRYYDKNFSLSIIENLKFSWSKIKRIYPLHLITCLICFAWLLLLFFFTNGGSSNGVIRLFCELVGNILLIQSWVPIDSFPNSLNGVAWYLSVSVFLYFLFPYIKTFIQKRKNSHLILYCLLALLFGLFITGVSLIFLVKIKDGEPIGEWTTYFFPLFNVPAFFVGCCLGKCYLESDHKNESSLKSNIFYTVLEALAIAVYLLAGYLRFPISPWWLGDMIFSKVRYIVFISPLVYIFAINKGYISRFLSNKLFVWLGSLTANAYLIHYTLIIPFLVLSNLGVNVFNGNDLLMFLLVLPITFILSYLYKLADKSIRNKKKLKEA